MNTNHKYNTRVNSQLATSENIILVTSESKPKKSIKKFQSRKSIKRSKNNDSDSDESDNDNEESEDEIDNNKIHSEMSDFIVPDD